MGTEQPRAAVTVDGVSKRFRIYHERNQTLKSAVMRGGRAKAEEFWALRDVGFTIPKGSTFGLIGENGSGKSTLLKCIAKILQPNHGRIVTNGSVSALLELGSGFHPELTGRENIFLNAAILGMRKADVEAKFDEIVDFAGVREFIDQPVKNYSSGMYVRLGFSVAINVDPDILLVDEVLAVGDARFQERCMEKFGEFRRSGKTVVLVSHAMGSMRAMCDEVAWLDHGRLMSVGGASDLVADYVNFVHTGSSVEDDDASHSGDGPKHWGSGEARIEQIDVLDKTGTRRTSLPFGEPFTVRVRYRTSAVIDKPVFGLAVETVEGHVLWGSNTREAGLQIDRASGTGTVEFTVDQAPLQGSRLAVVASITDFSTTHVYDFLRDMVHLSVDSARPVESGGPVALRGSWQHRPDGPTDTTDG